MGGVGTMRHIEAHQGTHLTVWGDWLWGVKTIPVNRWSSLEGCYILCILWLCVILMVTPDNAGCDSLSLCRTMSILSDYRLL